MKVNVMLLKCMSFLGFAASAVLTIMLMTSQTPFLTLAWFVTILMAIILEFCKMFFAYQGLVNDKLPIGLRAIAIIIALGLFGASIAASEGFLFNQANQAKNSTIKNSIQYQAQQQQQETSKNLFAQKQKEIKDMEILRDSYPENYYTKKQEVQTMINAKSKELEKIGQDITNSLNIGKLKTDVVETKGYTALFQSIANSLNKNESFKESPITAESVEVFFFSFLGIIFEAAAIILFVFASLEERKLVSVHQVKPGTPFKIPPTNDEPGLDKRLVDQWQQPSTLTQEEKDKMKPKQDPKPKPAIAKIGFELPQIQPKSFSDDELKTYIRAMVDTKKKDNSIDGYIKISKACGISEGKGRKIHGYLDKSQIIESRDRKSYICRNPLELLKT